MFGFLWAGLVIAAGMIANLGLDTIADLHDTDPVGAATTWSALDVVLRGLGGGNELVGGIWILLVSVGAARTRALPAPANYVGLASGAAGVLTVLPGLEPVGAVFGAGLIIWFVWVGVFLLRASSRMADAGPVADSTPIARVPG